jgi:hypothetical protein
VISLTQNQKEIRQRIKQSIEQEIGMCDDQSDLILLATILFDGAKTIFTPYAEDFGTDALERAVALSRKVNKG